MILGKVCHGGHSIPQSTDVAEITLYRHPDVNNGNADKFKIVTEAYETLSRKLYNSGYSPRSDEVRVHYHPSQSGRRRRPPITSGFGNPAIVVWGAGLAIGCCLFGGALLLGQTDLYNHNVYRGSPSRHIEPSSDTSKRERIARLLTERTREAQGLEPISVRDSSSSSPRSV